MLHLGRGKDGNKGGLSEHSLYGPFCVLKYTEKLYERILG